MMLWDIYIGFLIGVDTEFALEAHRRRQALETRFRNVRMRDSKVCIVSVSTWRRVILTLVFREKRTLG